MGRRARTLLAMLLVGAVAHAEAHSHALLVACAEYGRVNVPGWALSQHADEFAPPLVEEVYGDINDGMCRGYMAVGPRGQRRDVLVFTLRCQRRVCRPVTP